jgi:hypothetical protein
LLIFMPKMGVWSLHIQHFCKMTEWDIVYMECDDCWSEECETHSWINKVWGMSFLQKMTNLLFNLCQHTEFHLQNSPSWTNKVPCMSFPQKITNLFNLCQHACDLTCWNQLWAWIPPKWQAMNWDDG